MTKRVSDADKPRYVLYFRGHRPPDVYPRHWVPIYWDPALAHGVILKFLGTAGYIRDGNSLVLPESDLRLRCEQLDAVLATSPTEVPDDIARTVLRFKLGSWEEDHSKNDEVEVVTENGEVKVEKVKAPKPEKPKKPTKPDGWITIGEWCEKWKLKPMDARAALRGSGLTKPDFGWAFDPKREKEIKKICGVK